MHVLQTASPSSAPKPALTFAPVSRAEGFVIVLGLLLFSQALLGRLFASEDNPEGGAILRFLWLPVYGYCMIMLALNWRKVFTIISRAPFLTLLSVLAMLSALWSIDPGTSFRRGIAVFFTFGFGLYLAARLSWRDLLRYMGLTWFILAIGNLIAGALTPSFGVMHEIHPGAWRGLWFEKNAMGGFFARAAFLFAFLAILDRDWRRLWCVSLVLSVGLVLLSTSKTSLLGMLLGFGILGAWLWMRGNRFLTLVSLWSLFTLGLSVGLFLFLMPETAASIIGRDLTLTGRTDIWAVLLEVMEERPVLGFGYGTFWALDSEPAEYVRAVTEWEVPTAHNGLLEVMLALGRLGAAVFVLDFLLNVWRAMSTIHRRSTSIFAFGSFAVFALFSISESIILNQNSITWLTYCAIAGKLALDAAPVRERETRQPARFNDIRLPPKPEPTQPLRGRTHS